MSRVPRSSRWESTSPGRAGSSRTLYEPTWPTETPSEGSRRASVRPSLQHTDPEAGSYKRKDQGATSRGSHVLGRRDVQHGQQYTSATFQTVDSQKLISELRREISDLKREARGRTPAQDMPRNKVNASKRGHPEDFEYAELSVTPGSQLDSGSLTPQTVHKKPLILGQSSRSRPPLHGGTSHPTKEHSAKNATRPEGQNAVWRAFDLISSSPFSKEIEKAQLPERYTAPRFEIYNGRTDPVTHVGHYQQTMAVSRRNDPLMCRLFPSSLGEVAMRWFNQLGRRTIGSWDQMAEAFVARFITNSRRAKEMDALLTMKLQEGETVKNYFIRFWETYNDIDGRNEEIAINTFKLGLLIDSGLRRSLIKRPPTSLAKLMNKIDQYVRLEEDRKVATPVQTAAQPKDIIAKPLGRSTTAAKNLSTPSNFVAPTFRAFETVFKEPIYKIMEKIKREPFFVWPPKLLGNPALRDSKLYCTYHRDTGHMTENCHMLKVHLEKLVSAGHLGQFVDTDLSEKKEPGQISRPSPSPGVPSAGVIHVIHNPHCSAISSGSYRSRIQKAAHLRKSYSIVDSAHPAQVHTVNKGDWKQVISFSDDDLKDVQLPHNDPLVVTLRIGNFDVQRVLIDPGSFAEVMYQDLYSKLGLGKDELSSFSWPIYGFSGEPTVPLGRTIMPVLAGPINLQTKFIVVEAPSPYNAIWGVTGCTE